MILSIQDGEKSLVSLNKDMKPGPEVVTFSATDAYSVAKSKIFEREKKWAGLDCKRTELYLLM